MNAGLKDVEGDPERHRDDDEVVEEGPWWGQFPRQPDDRELQRCEEGLFRRCVVLTDDEEGRNSFEEGCWGNIRTSGGTKSFLMRDRQHGATSVKITTFNQMLSTRDQPDTELFEVFILPVLPLKVMNDLCFNGKKQIRFVWRRQTNSPQTLTWVISSLRRKPEPISRVICS